MSEFTDMELVELRDALIGDPGRYSYDAYQAICFLQGEITRLLQATEPVEQHRGGDAVSIVINPGTGPVGGATLEWAQSNMIELCLDVARQFEIDANQITWATPRDQAEDQGRWPFYLVIGDWDPHTVHCVEMPGLPLGRVRWMGEAEQNIWDFPRLYVDGSSWVWKFAIGCCGPAREETDHE